MLRSILSVGILTAMTISVQAADEVKIEKVSLEGLSKAIATHKGKIVVIDIWATFCAPCKEKFPHMVELHNKLKDKGVVFVSLSVDEPADIANALDFLKSKKAFFPNYLLDDTDKNKADWEEKFATQSPPIVHIYDRSGIKVKTMEGKKQLAEMDKFLEDLVNKK